MIGGSLFGQLADTFGRKPVLLVTMYGHIALGVGVAFAPSFAAFTALRFFLGLLIQVLIRFKFVLVHGMCAVLHMVQYVSSALCKCEQLFVRNSLQVNVTSISVSLFRGVLPSWQAVQ